jgi:outer membrane protein insertion porin family
MKERNILFYYLISILIISSGYGQKIVGSIEFIGNDQFKKGELLKWSEISIGSQFIPETVEHANVKIISSLHDAGYRFARIDSVVTISEADSQSVSLRWYLTEDFPFRYGEIKIIADSIPTQPIHDRFELKSGAIYNESEIEYNLSEITRYLAQTGFPLANIRIENTQIKRQETFYAIDLHLRIIPGRKVVIDDIVIKGNRVTDDKVILRELDITSGETYNQEKIDLIPRKLNRLGFFKAVNPAKLVMLEEQKSAIVVEVEEGNTTTFDGILGYVPPTQDQRNQEGFFTGMIQISFRNLFGTGRKFEVDWKKPDRFSDEFKLYYQEPWLMNYPLSIGLGLERVVRDTTYIKRSYFFDTALRISSTLSGTLIISQNSFIPDSAASRDMRLARNTLLEGEVGLKYDTRDYPINPKSGLLYFTTYSFGFKKFTGPSYLLAEDNLAEREEVQKIKVGLSYYQSLWKNQVLYINIFGANISGSENQLQLTDHVWFGGARSIRGYRENQFHGTTVSWVNLEYRFFLGRDSRFFIFNDWGFYAGRNLPGYGIGIRFRTPLGIMGFDYGLGKGDTFSTGKIHFGIINQF